MAQHKSAKIDCQQILDGFCGVCFTGFRKVTPRKLDEGIQALVCRSCKCTVHQCCYAFDTNYTFLTEKVRQFICQRCIKPQLKSKSCIVCNGSEGVFSEIGDNEVIHIFCGLIHQQINVTQYYPQIKFQKTPFFQENKLLCQICGRRNANDHCAEQSCKKKVHTYCAKMEHKMKQDEEAEDYWKFMMSCGENNCLDLHDEIIQPEWVAEDNDNILRNLEQYEVYHPHKHQIRKQVYDEYYSEAVVKRRNSKKIRRGGFIYVVCSKHGIEQYCSCLGRSEGQMVFCQCCFEWYHATCVKYTQKKEDSYICKQCIQFYDLKRKMIDEVRSKKNENYQLKNEYPHKMSMMDLMWILRVMDQRIAGGGSNKMMKVISKVPLKTSKMEMLVKAQSRNKIIAMSENILIEYLKIQYGELKALAVLALDNQHKPITLYQNIEHNRKLKEYISFIRMFVKNNRLPDLYAQLEKQLEFKQRAVCEDYETILSLCKSNQGYPQLEVLRMKAEAYSFMQTIKKAKTGQTIQFKLLQQAVKKAKLANNVPPYLLNPLIDTYQQSHNLVMEIIKQLKNPPESLKSVQQKLQSLAQLKVSPPAHYQIYQHQLKLITDLYLLYLKESAQPLSNLSINQQITQLLTQNAIQPTKQLCNILDSHPKTQLRVINNMEQIIDKYTQLCIQYQIKNAFITKTIQPRRLDYLIHSSKPSYLHKYSPNVKVFIQTWSNLDQRSLGILQQDLANLDDYSSIDEYSNKIKQIINDYTMLPIDQSRQQHSNLIKLTQRNQQLNQLKILYTETQLQKNPLSLQKISSNLPKSNSLVKSYLNLRKEQDTLNEKYKKIISKINQKIQNLKQQTKKQRKQQIKDNSQKPSINQINEFIQILINSKVESTKYVKNLTDMVNQTILIASEVKKYCSKHNDYEQANNQQLKKAKDQIDEMRKKVLLSAQLNLKTQLVNLYHLEICYRMRMMILNPTSELQKINKVLKFAEEEGLTHLASYKQLKNTYDQKNQSKQQVTLIRSIEQMLNDESQKGGDAVYANLENVRKTLPIRQVNASKDIGSYLQGLIEKNKVVRKKVDQILNRSNKHDFNYGKSVYLDALKSPYIVPRLAQLTNEFNKFQKLLQKWKQQAKPSHSAALYFIQYDDMIFTSEQIEQIRNSLKITQQTIQQFDLISQQPISIQNCCQIEQLMENMQQQNAIAESTIYESIKIKYINYWLKVVQQYSQTKQDKISYQKIKRLLIQSYSLIQTITKRNGNCQVLRQSVQKLESIMDNIISKFKENSNSQIPLVQIDGYIDVYDLYYEIQGSNIQDQIVIQYPFNDLIKFKYVDLLRQKSNNNSRDDIAIKRGRTADEYQMRQQLNEQSHELSSMKQEKEEIPQTVNEMQRKVIKDILLKNINKNPQFKDCDQYVKMIENQIFGEWHNNIKKYLQVSDSFEKLFIKLLGCPKISAKVAKKKFQIGFLKLMLDSLPKIKEYQAMMVSKSKQEDKVKDKVDEKLKLAFLQPKQTAVEKSNNILDMLVSGKVNETEKQDLRKQIKAVKESNRHHHHKESSKHSKKRKHHKRKSRSRSPSKSPSKQAKFSPEDQRELPTYIQKEYSNIPIKDPIQPAHMTPTNTIQWQPQPIIYAVQKVYEDPLMFDPQANAENEELTYYHKGSVLKIKDVEIQLILKKNKLEFKGMLMTDQDHRKVITQLVDPQFNKISIKRQKNDQQIIQYLNKPAKKKYKYLVGWIEANNNTSNEQLRDFAIESNDRKKIFGIQNDNIKMHIMSIKQLILINRLHTPPNRASTQQAANILKDDRMVFILQYPADKMYQLKCTYPNFTNIQLIENPFEVNIPSLPEIDHYKTNYSGIKPLINPINSIIPISTVSQKEVQYEGWGSQPSNIPTSYPPTSVYPQPIQSFMHSSFSPITTEEEDNGQKEQKDYTSYLLNSINESNLKSVSQSLSTPSIPPIREQSYSNYRFMQPTPPPPERWAPNYGSIPNPPTSTYNPMPIPKYNPNINSGMNMMYKNPMAYVPLRDNRGPQQQHFDSRNPMHFEGGNRPPPPPPNYDPNRPPQNYDGRPQYFHDPNKY